MSTATAAPSVPTTDDEWLKTRPVRLAAGVSLITGAGDHPMLHDSERGRYVRLSPGAKRLVPLLDGRYTAGELAATVAARSGVPEMHEAVLRLVDELRQSGVLDIAPRPEDVAERLLRASSGQHLVRFPLTRSPERLLAAPARALCGLAPRPALAALAFLLLAAAATVVGGLVAFGVPAGAVSWPLIIALMLAQVVTHEGSHALVSQLFGVPAREAGVALLYGFMPVAYVDRTDAYRLRGRLPRAAIALAGPANDLLWAGATAAIALTQHGVVGASAQMLVWFQLGSLVAVLNPFLPTDGYRAVESLAGQLNFRGRTIAFLAHRLAGRDAPAHLRVSTRRQRLSYVVFAAGCVAYALLALVGTVLALTALVS
jgi:putative peptide zinc metalloprotease protein